MELGAPIVPAERLDVAERYVAADLKFAVAQLGATRTETSKDKSFAPQPLGKSAGKTVHSTEERATGHGNPYLHAD